MNGRTSASLWQEFAISTKGARQLVWGRGLKLLKIEEKTDEELAEETEKHGYYFGRSTTINFFIVM